MKKQQPAAENARAGALRHTPVTDAESRVTTVREGQPRRTEPGDDVPQPSAGTAAAQPPTKKGKE